VRTGMLFLKPQEPAIGHSQFPGSGHWIHFRLLSALQGCCHWYDLLFRNLVAEPWPLAPYTSRITRSAQWIIRSQRRYCLDAVSASSERASSSKAFSSSWEYPVASSTLGLSLGQPSSCIRDEAASSQALGWRGACGVSPGPNDMSCIGRNVPFVSLIIANPFARSTTDFTLPRQDWAVCSISLKGNANLTVPPFPLSNRAGAFSRNKFSREASRA